MQALFSASKTDDTQWLTYWVTFAFLTYDYTIQPSFILLIQFVVSLRASSAPSTGSVRNLVSSFLRS